MVNRAAPQTALPRIPWNVPHHRAPHIETCVSIGSGDPEEKHHVTFLIDTGSAYTILSPRDADLFEINLNQPSSKLLSIDATAELPCVKISATLRFFPKPGSLQTVLGLQTEIYADIGDESDWGNYPSVLGRDVLRRFNIKLDPPAKDGDKRHRNFWRFWLKPKADHANKFTLSTGCDSPRCQVKGE